jgi:hypothetical protein
MLWGLPLQVPAWVRQEEDVHRIHTHKLDPELLLGDPQAAHQTRTLQTEAARLRGVRIPERQIRMQMVERLPPGMPLRELRIRMPAMVERLPPGTLRAEHRTLMLVEEKRLLVLDLLLGAHLQEQPTAGVPTLRQEVRLHGVQLLLQTGTLEQVVQAGNRAVQDGRRELIVETGEHRRMEIGYVVSFHFLLSYSKPSF